MSGSVLVFQDSNYVYGCRLSALSPSQPQKRFCCRTGGSSKCPLWSITSTNHQQRNGEFGKLQIYSKKIKKSATHGTSCAPFCWVSFIAGLFPGVHEEEEDPFWWVLSVQLGLFSSFLTPLKTTN